MKNVKIMRPGWLAWCKQAKLWRIQAPLKLSVPTLASIRHGDSIIIQHQ